MMKGSASESKFPYAENRDFTHRLVKSHLLDMKKNCQCKVPQYHIWGREMGGRSVLLVRTCTEMYNKDCCPDRTLRYF